MYPWLGGHGSIEGGRCRRRRKRYQVGIHGWEVMAPLKAEAADGHAYDDQRIHGWEVMAPLKAYRASSSTDRLGGYPWLGGHGSIEGIFRLRWLIAGGRYPWLGGHGSIEGAYGKKFVQPGNRVSMAGRSWLH